MGIVSAVVIMGMVRSKAVAEGVVGLLKLYSNLSCPVVQVFIALTNVNSPFLEPHNLFSDFCGSTYRINMAQPQPFVQQLPLFPQPFQPPPVPTSAIPAGQQVLPPSLPPMHQVSVCCPHA